MKNINLIIFGALAIILAIAGGVSTLMSFNKYQFDIPAKAMLENITTENHFISMAEVAKSTEAKGQVVIDIRNPKEFVNDHIPNAINIPYARLLDDDYKEIFNTDKSKIIYGNSSVEANAAWMILSQYGIEKLIVLDGSISDWNKQIEDNALIKVAYKSDETPKFDYAAEMKK